MSNLDVIVVGSGIGGLVAGALLAHYGRRVLICESHTIAGGAAHSFSRQGFHFDSGPSFYCGLSDPRSLNPLRQVLDLLEESVPAIAYNPLGHYHFPDSTFPVYCESDRYRAEVAKITPQGAKELGRLEQRFLKLYSGLRDIPTLALRADWQLLPLLLSRYPLALLKLLPQIGTIQGSVGDLLHQVVQDPWVRRLIDLECFLLSGLTAADTIAPEVAFMFGERTRSVVDYPIGGSGAIVQALVRGLEKGGGELRLNAHVEQILLTDGRAIGVQLRNGEVLKAPTVISNATLWDTVTQLLPPDAMASDERQAALATPAVASFMHLHLGIRAEGLEGLTGHHVVVHSAEADVTTPGNTCMISIPSVWDAGLAPAAHHVVHAYTLEPYEAWQQDDPRSDRYQVKKRDRALPLYRALERVIPNIRDRTTLELIGTPLTHARFLRRHRGTYGPAIAAGQGMFPATQTAIAGLYRVGDSTLPGIGVPAVAASGILCANTLVSVEQTLAALNKIGR